MLQIRAATELASLRIPSGHQLEEFMKPLGISARQLAADIEVSPSRISEFSAGICRNDRVVTNVGSLVRAVCGDATRSAG